jgi:acyl-CoA synthetase (AMP-forming)/AMP-acid ligase II
VYLVTATSVDIDVKKGSMSYASTITGADERGVLTAATLRWSPGPALTPERRDELMGRGGPFEITEADVLGTRHEIFVRRLPHLRALLEQGATRFGDHPYLVQAERTVTFGEAAQMVANAAAALADEHGIRRGDRVAIAAANRYDYVIVAWAVIVLGGVVVGLNGWWTGAEFEHGIRLTSPKLLIGDRRRLSRLDGLVGDLPRRDLDEVSAAWFGRRSPLPDCEIDEDDPFVILFTSGTTGRPKGAVLTHRNNIHWIQSIGLRQAAAGGAADDTCEIAALPLFHISGLNCQAISSLSTGTKLVYMPPGRWTPEDHLRLTEEHGVTTWRLVPTQAWRLLESPEADRYDLSSLRSIVGGGSFWSPALLERLAAKWPHVRPGLVVGLGMTETNGTGATATMPGLLERPGNLGGRHRRPPFGCARLGKTSQLTPDGLGRSRYVAPPCSWATTATRDFRRLHERRPRLVVVGHVHESYHVVRLHEVLRVRLRGPRAAGVVDDDDLDAVTVDPARGVDGVSPGLGPSMPSDASGPEQVQTTPILIADPVA